MVRLGRFSSDDFKGEAKDFIKRRLVKKADREVLVDKAVRTIDVVKQKAQSSADQVKSRAQSSADQVLLKAQLSAENMTVRTEDKLVRRGARMGRALVWEIVTDQRIVLLMVVLIGSLAYYYRAAIGSLFTSAQ